MSASGLVTILFTDVVGSTEINSAIGDRAADELRRLHFEDLNEAIAATNGTLVKTIGDAVMASYTSAADALHGAVEMQRAVDRRNRRASGQDLHVRIGVSAGDATFEDEDWFGTPVVEASRLCSAATSDQILISDLVGALAGSRIDHEITSLGLRELKGLPSPIGVSEVEWRSDDVDVATVPLPGFVDTNPSFAFAGRAAQLEAVRMAWKEAIEQRCRAVLISGEPGVGKTRLVTEFVRTAHDDGGVVLWGRCDEELEVPYQPFAEALRLFVASITDERVQTDLGAFAADLSLLVPDLGKRIPGLTIQPIGDPDAERHRLFEAVGDAFSVIARTDAVVLVLDDIHWADKPSLLLLRYLLRRGEPIRLLILGTYRDTDLDRSHPLADVLADLRREPCVERVDLVGLGLDEITSFMELAAGHDLDAPGLELARAVHRETEGNPFFLSEMIRHLAESGYIVQRDGQWVSDYTLDQVGIPEGIREVVGRRLSALSSTVNAALSIAAVIGPEFDVATIDAAGGPSGDDLFDALDDAVRASVIREVAGSYGRYAFAHALVRSTLYDELSTNRRVRLHWKVGEALAARHGSEAQYVDQLAHHFGEGAMAGDPMLALEWCVKAAERAAGDLAFEAAIRSYERALAALELVADPDLAVQADIEIARTEMLRHAGDEGFLDAGFRAAATARRLGDSERLARAVLAMDQDGPPGATAAGDPLLALITEALETLDAEPSELRAGLLGMQAVRMYWGREHDARIATGLEALAMAREVGSAASMSQILARSWAFLDASQPNMHEIAAYSRETLALARPGTGAYMNALENLSAAAATSGDTDAALDYLDRYSTMARETRLSVAIFRSMNFSALLAVHVGEIERAESEALEAFEYGNQHAHAEGAMANYGGIIYNVRRAQGRGVELLPLLEGLVDSQPTLPVWRIALAGACYFAGRTDELREHVTWLSAERCARIPIDIEYPVTLCGLGRLAPYADLDAETCEFIYATLGPFAGTMNYTGTSISDANDVALACLADHLGRHDVADGHYRDAITLADRARAIPYGAHYRYEWARALVDRGDSERAKPLLAEVADIAEGHDMHGPDGYVTWSAKLLDRIS
jgi:class 3 adenylate cyclase/tetratricopeptide (TPR) repeat protein/KaiC/GvpD/RAD55 family RecA-like ATPase